MDTGLRRGEVVALTDDDLDLPLGVIHVRVSKVRRERLVSIGTKARTELRLWLRARAAYFTRRGQTDSGALFIGREGRPMTGEGLYQAIERRAQRAGVRSARLVHVWRHGWATRALAGGAGELDVQVLGGWRSLAMVARYTASNRQERALREHARWSPGDRI
jgi:site-specific recombinase XerD